MIAAYVKRTKQLECGNTRPKEVWVVLGLNSVIIKDVYSKTCKPSEVKGTYHTVIHMMRSEACENNCWRVELIWRGRLEFAEEIDSTSAFVSE